MEFEKIINHKIIGEISLLDFSCSTVKKMKFLDRNEEFRIYFKDAENGNISEKQIETFKWLIENSEDVLKKVEEGIFKYYTSIHEQLVEEWGEDDDIPNINNSKDLTAVLRREYSFFIKPDWCDYIGFASECTWEPEHGLGVKIVDGEVIKVGLQDIIL